MGTKILSEVRNILKIAAFFIVAASLMGCFKEPNFSMSPEISFADIDKNVVLDIFTGATKDSLIISINFQDGDGDLGLTEQEKADAQANNDFNYLVKPLRKTNGTFQYFTPAEPLSGYFPSLKSETKPGAIEGVLSYGVDFFHAFTPKYDTLKFEIQIKDRAGNMSNIIETDEIVLNEF